MPGKPLIPGLVSPSVTEVTCATVLFADLHGYDVAVNLLPPVDVATLLGELFELLTDIIFEHGGQVFGLREAGALAGFGVGDTRHARTFEALASALAMQRAFATLRAQWQAQRSIDTALGIGIHRGDVAVGVFGPAEYASLTLVGDAAQCAAHLARRARAGEILLSAAAYVPDPATGGEPTPRPALQHLPQVQIRGRQAPLDVWCAPLANRLPMRPAAPTAASN